MDLTCVRCTGCLQPVTLNCELHTVITIYTNDDHAYENSVELEHCLTRKEAEDYARSHNHPTAEHIIKTAPLQTPEYYDDEERFVWVVVDLKPGGSEFHTLLLDEEEANQKAKQLKNGKVYPYAV